MTSMHCTAASNIGKIATGEAIVRLLSLPFAEVGASSTHDGGCGVTCCLR